MAETQKARDIIDEVVDIFSDVRKTMNGLQYLDKSDLALDAFTELSAGMDNIESQLSSICSKHKELELNTKVKRLNQIC